MSTLCNLNHGVKPGSRALPDLSKSPSPSHLRSRVFYRWCINHPIQSRASRSRSVGRVASGRAARRRVARARRASRAKSQPIGLRSPATGAPARVAAVAFGPPRDRRGGPRATWRAGIVALIPRPAPQSYAEAQHWRRAAKALLCVGRTTLASELLGRAGGSVGPDPVGGAFSEIGVGRVERRGTDG